LKKGEARRGIFEMLVATSKEEVKPRNRLDHVGNQRGETSEGREPHECDQGEKALGSIGRNKASKG